MPTWNHGIERASTEIIGGFTIAIVIRLLLQSLGFGYIIVIFDLLSITAIIELTSKMTYWSLSYMLGWFIGLIMSFTIFYQFLSGWEIALYIIVTGIVLTQKIVRKMR